MYVTLPYSSKQIFYIIYFMLYLMYLSLLFDNRKLTKILCTFYLFYLSQQWCLVFTMLYLTVSPNGNKCIASSRPPFCKQQHRTRQRIDWMPELRLKDEIWWAWLTSCQLTERNSSFQSEHVLISLLPSIVCCLFKMSIVLPFMFSICIIMWITWTCQ